MTVEEYEAKICEWLVKIEYPFGMIWDKEFRPPVSREALAKAWRDDSLAWDAANDRDCAPTFEDSLYGINLELGDE